MALNLKQEPAISRNTYEFPSLPWKTNFLGLVFVGKTIMPLSIDVTVIISPKEEVKPGMEMAVFFMLAKIGLMDSIFRDEHALFWELNKIVH